VLTVLLARHASMTKLLDLPPTAFTPPPKVRSSVVRLAFHAATPLVPDEARFAQMVKALFSQRRKMLSNALKRFDPQQGPSVLERSGIDGHRRPETLTLEELARLAALFAGTPETRVL
jgi:16S rRNA (adenine1518-N6/adenine1519-N6)-dimethyltransferase